MSWYNARSGSYSPTFEPDDPLHEMSDIYGQTPPRTRYNRRQRERKQRILWSESKQISSMKESRANSSLRRRNTFDSIIFNKLCDQADDEDRIKEIREEAVNDGNRKCKRTLKLARDSERNFKLDVSSDSMVPQNFEQQTDAKRQNNNMKALCGVIETKNRFRCLRSKPVDVNEEKRDNVATHSKFSQSVVDPVNVDDCGELSKSKSEQERKLFHDTFSFLIRLGSNDRERNCRRQMSSEESRWQNELKDLIWLELQAFHADRTLVEQDEYLCKQRENIGRLLTKIMEYRYDPMSSHAERGSITASSSDSGISSSITPETCSGCLSMHCHLCSRSQMVALKQVEHLLCQLEKAESLYPSSQAFATQFPLYKDTAFTDRIKAMCLWYNMTRHHRLKLRILSKLLLLLDKSKMNFDFGNDSSLNLQSSAFEVDLGASAHTLDCNIVNNTYHETGTSSSSNTSHSSLSLGCDGNYNIRREFSSPPTPESSIFSHDDRLDSWDFYLTEFDRPSYRKYIEEVLKTRGLTKSLNFLERLHTSVLRRASLTLKQCENGEKNDSDDEYEGDWELRRYGVWSLEAQDLNLPSYRSAFIFLSRVPLDVVHEFLRMRLEQKPEQPGPLSIRQLMREMREGLRIACIHRDRFIENSKTVMACEAANCNLNALDIYDINEFDNSLKAVFQVYLDYLYKWMEMMAFNSDNKNIIEDEWMFVKTIASNINDGYSIGSIQFCNINCMMVEQVKDYLNLRPQEIFDSMVAMDNGNDDSTIKFHLMSVGREYQGMFVEAREKIMKCLMIANLLNRDIYQQFETRTKSIALNDAVENLKRIVLSLRECITAVIKEFEIRADEAEDDPKIEHDYLAMHTRIREIFHQAYRMGFDYYKEICRLFCYNERQNLVHHLVDFSKLWMTFVMNKCERGRGLRPRWANHGLEFLIIVCEPSNTRYLSDAEFEELKTNMDRCISHVIGEVATVGELNHSTDQDKENRKRISRSGATSPASPLYSHMKQQTVGGISSKLRDNTHHKSLFNLLPVVDNVAMSLIIPEYNVVKQSRFLSAIEKLEKNLDDKRRGAELIGRITDQKSVLDKIRIKLRRVTFTWQRGIKIGQGRFGKVYTVVNNQTGELLAMKEVASQPGDHIAIRRVAEELEIFEGIKHKHLVRYYGIEIQREEMLIFMEFCAEGTLESFVAGSGSSGLPEIFIRKYTHQLLLAVSILHSHGIVHRDIKTANIFLTDQTNCLKLGDFGSAVKIKSHTTMPGELQGFVGTQAYMAPEVFMKTESVGHGRAADIWSVGCCIIEMASGKRPWAEYDSNYQIMFKVGMGESPQPPKYLCKEGVDLIAKCLEYDAKERPSALSLLSHSFARNCDDINTDLSTQVVI